MGGASYQYAERYRTVRDAAGSELPGAARKLRVDVPEGRTNALSGTERAVTV
jgi:hypothetical protein